MQLAKKIQRRDPVLGVRAAGQRDGAGSRLVAVGAVDHVDVGEVADATVNGGFRQVLLGVQHRRAHRQLGHLHVVEQGTRTEIVTRRQAGELVAVRPLRRDMLTPGERRHRQRDTEQRHHRTERDRRPAQPHSQRDRNDRTGGGRGAVAQRVLDISQGQVGQRARQQQHAGTLDEVGVRVPGEGQPEDQQRPMPQIQRARHRPQRHERLGGQQPVGGGQPAAVVRVGHPVGRGQDEQHRRADRHQRPRPGKFLDAVYLGRPPESERTGNRGDHILNRRDDVRNRADQIGGRRRPHRRAGADRRIGGRRHRIGDRRDRHRGPARPRRDRRDRHQGPARPRRDRRDRIGDRRDRIRDRRDRHREPARPHREPARPHREPASPPRGPARPPPGSRRDRRREPASTAWGAGATAAGAGVTTLGAGATAAGSRRHRLGSRRTTLGAGAPPWGPASPPWGPAGRVFLRPWGPRRRGLSSSLVSVPAGSFFSSLASVPSFFGFFSAPVECFWLVSVLFAAEPLESGSATATAPPPISRPAVSTQTAAVKRKCDGTTICSHQPQGPFASSPWFAALSHSPTIGYTGIAS